MQDFDPVSAYHRFRTVFRRGQDDSDEEDTEIDDFGFENIFCDGEADKELGRLTSAWKRASKVGDSQTTGYKQKYDTELITEGANKPSTAVHESRFDL